MMKPLSWYKGLAEARRRREQGFFLIEGRRAVDQIRATAPAGIDEILVTEQLSSECSGYGAFACPVRVVTARQLAAIGSAKTPQGIAAVVRIPEGSYENGLPGETGDRLLLLEGVQDPGNVGTCIRTAAAFDFNGVILSEACADAFSPKAVQASAGSVLSVWTRRTERYLDVAEELKKKGFALIAADCEGASLTPGHGNRAPCVIMLGSEGAGLGEKLLALANEKIRIPMNGRKAGSLNVAAAGAILMFQVSGALPDIKGEGEGR